MIVLVIQSYRDFLLTLWTDVDEKQNFSSSQVIVYTVRYAALVKK